MMNMFQLQERIKDFSKDQLVREMQQPSGAVPPFMVLSELQRRTRMEKAFQADQAQAPQSTVAQDAVNAAGVPQGGIADMARAMAPQTDMGGNTGAAPVQQMRTGGEVKRMQPGGLTGNADLDEALKELEQARIRLAAATRAARGDDSPLSEVSADVGSFTPAPISAAPMTSAGALPGIDAMQNPLGRLRPTQPNTQMLVGPGADAAPTVDMAPPGPTQPEPQWPPGSIEDAVRMMELNDIIYPRGAPAIEPQIDTSGAYADLLGAPTRAEAMFGDIGPLQGPMQGPSTPRVSSAAEGLTDEALAAIAGVPSAVLAPVQGPNLPPPPSDPSGLGLPEFMFSPRGTVPEPQPGEGIMPSDIGRAIGEGIGLGPAMDVARATRTTPDALPMDTGTPLTVPDEADGGIEALLAPPAAAAAADRSGGAGAGAGARATGAADADKWLALAQFGLGLMASQQPTLGGAVGEAGTAALGQLRESQTEAYERDLAERTLAARSAGSRRGPSFGNLISLANARITAAEAALERLNMDGITDLEKAVDKGRGDEFRSATADLLDANNLLRSLGPAMAGDLSNVDYNLTQQQ